LRFVLPGEIVERGGIAPRPIQGFIDGEGDALVGHERLVTKRIRSPRSVLPGALHDDRSFADILGAARQERQQRGGMIGLLAGVRAKRD